MNGRVTGEIFGFGVLLTAALYFFMIKAMGYPWRRALRALSMFLLYLLNLLWGTVKAAAAVACLALTPSAHPEPVLVEF